MKFLRLLFSRFELYFRRNKLIFCLMLLSGIMTAIMLLYSYGNLLPIVFNRTSDELYYRTYTAQVNPAELSEEDFTILRESGLLSSMELRIRVHGVPLGEFNGLPKYGTAMLAADLTNDPEIVSLAGENDFLEADPHSIILTTTQTKEDGTAYVIGDTYTIMDTEYTIIGRVSSDYSYLPIEAFVQFINTEDIQWNVDNGNLDIENSGITVISQSKYNTYQEDEVLALLQNVFPDTAIETPYMYALYDATSSYEQGVYMCILYAISMISFLMLFLFLVESTADVTAVYRIVGATGDTVANLHFWEVVLLAFGSSLLGVLIHALLYRPLFSKMNLVRELSYRFSDYCLVLFMMVVITLLLSLPFVWRATRLSPIAARRAAE